MKVGGVIVAGGMATRMGGREKLLLPLAGKSVLEIILHRVRPQVDAVAIDVRISSRHKYTSLLTQDIAVLSDPFMGKVGPLAGIVAGLQWLTTQRNEFEWLATFPGDTPFLPHDLVSHLKSCSQPESLRPVVALDRERVQSLCALWPVTCLKELIRGVQQGHLRSVQGALNKFDAIQCPLQTDRFFININTEQDLAELERQIEMQPQLLGVN